MGDSPRQTLRLAKRALAQLEADKPSLCPLAYETGLAAYRKAVIEFAEATLVGERLANRHKRIVQSIQVCAIEEAVCVCHYR